MGTEKFEYNKDNGIVKATDNENRETTVAYKAANTEVSETDQAANTSSFMQYDQFGNPIATTRELGTGENLIQNPSFEMNGTEKWVPVNVNNSGSITKMQHRHQVALEESHHLRLQRKQRIMIGAILLQFKK